MKPIKIKAQTTFKYLSFFNGLFKLTENELKVGNALISILENWESVFEGQEATNKYNKNLILYYMREMTSLGTKDIRNAMKRYKSIYKLIKDGDL